MCCEVPHDASKQLRLRPILSFDGGITRSTKWEREKGKRSKENALLPAVLMKKWKIRLQTHSVVSYHIFYVLFLGISNSHHRFHQEKMMILMSRSFLYISFILSVYIISIPSITFPFTTNVRYIYTHTHISINI